MATSSKEVTFANENGLPLTQIQTFEKNSEIGLCPELKVPLLTNVDLLCWFDSGNFALFHKKRPELEYFFNDILNDEEKFKNWNTNLNISFNQDDIEILKNIYNHLNGSNIQENFRNLVENFRQNQKFQDFFNKILPESEKETFSISSGNLNDVTDYIDSFEKLLIFNTEEQLTNSSFILDFFPNKIKIIDVLLDKKFSEQKNKFTTNTYTILIDTGLSPEFNNNNINFIEKLTIPLLDQDTNKTEIGNFLLDSIVVHTGGIHYFVIIKCNNKWVYYNDSEIKENQTLEEFIKITQIQKEDFNEEENRKLIKIGNPDVKDDIIEIEIDKLKKEYEKISDIRNAPKKIFNSFEEMRDSPVSNVEIIPNKGAKLLIYSRDFLTKPSISVSKSPIIPTESPKYLLLGGYPAQDDDKRDIYTDSQFYILDETKLKGDESFKDRYFELDFNNQNELKKFSQEHQKEFTKILFDWSVYGKFFKEDYTLENKLKLLLQTLAPNGIFVIENPGKYDNIMLFTNSTRTKIKSEEERKEERKKLIEESISKIENIMDKLKYKHEMKKLEDINDEIIQKVYKEKPDMDLMIITK